MNIIKRFTRANRRLRHCAGLAGPPGSSLGTPGVARAIAIALLLLIYDPGTAFAAAGTIDGVIKDALQRPIPGAQLRLESGAGRVVARTTTDDQGHFAFTGITAGTYVVVSEKTGFEAATAVVTVTDTAGGTAELTMASVKPLDVNVAFKKLEEARMEIQPRIGATTYSISKDAIQAQPGGDNNSITQVILQAPGVTLDSTQGGSYHIRNEHANVQYRINGVALPDGVSLFGQNGGLSPRLANSIDLITGSLPAEFGLHTAGIVDIQTKSGAFDPGGYLGMYGGQYSWINPSAEYRGSVGRFNYFVAGDFLQNSVGISPTVSRQMNEPLHDDTKQGHGLAYLEYLVDPTSKLTGIFGTFVGHFQIPNSPDQVPSFTVNGISDFDSRKVNENQLEQNFYGVVSYLKAVQDLTVRTSVFARYSTLQFKPDALPDLLFNGISQKLVRSSIATGLQAEASYVLTPTHTLRGGVTVNTEHMSVQQSSQVLPTTDGAQSSDTPFDIFQTTGIQGYIYSVYLQDAWKVLPTVTINAGMRFDYSIGLRDEYQPSPRLNVVWTPTPTTTVHAGYARYFTPPPLVFTSTAQINQFADTTAAPEVTKNATPRAERANYLDAGVTQIIIPGLKVGLDIYWKQATNLLDDGQFGAPVFLTPFNYAKGYNYGVEFTASYVMGNLTLYGNLAAARQWGKRINTAQSLFSADDLAYSYNHFIATDHVQLITASAGASYLWLGTRFSLDFIEQSGLRRSVVHPNDATVRPYQVANVGISRKFNWPAFGPMEARLDVKNLWDERYKIRDGSGLGVFAPQWGVRNGVFAGIRKEF
jgi:outer membrane receptor protein involved in Fe transport